MIMVYLLFGCANGMIVMQPVITAHIISTLAADGVQMLDRLLLWLAAMVGVMLLFWFFNGIGRAVEQAFAARLRQTLTLDLYRKLTGLPWEWHQVHHSGETLNKVTTAGKAVYSFANNQFWYLQVYLRLIGSLVGLLVLAPIVGLSVAASIPLFYLALRQCNTRQIGYDAAVNLEEGRVASGLLDYVGNIASILTLRLADSTGRNLDGRFDSLRRAQAAGRHVGMSG